MKNGMSKDSSSFWEEPLQHYCSFSGKVNPVYFLQSKTLSTRRTFVLMFNRILYAFFTENMSTDGGSLVD